ncbi:hypothetical protein BHE74_00032723, partial [Ensete ventricosum]
RIPTALTARYIYIFREFPTERWRSSSFVFSISAFPSSFVASPDASTCVPPPVYRFSREPPWSTLGFSSSSKGTPQDPKRESSQESASRTNIMVDSRVLAEQRGNLARSEAGIFSRIPLENFMRRRWLERSNSGIGSTSLPARIRDAVSWMFIFETLMHFLDLKYEKIKKLLLA